MSRNSLSRMSFLVPVALLIALVLSAAAGLADSRTPKPSNPFHIAIVPVKITGGDSLLRQKLPEAVETAFNNHGFTPIRREKVWRALPSGSDAGGVGLLAADQMARLGRRVGARFVAASEISITKSWRTWHITGPRANCDLKAFTRIVDADSGEVVFTDDSTYRTDGSDAYQKGVAILVSWPAAMFMGGHLDSQEVKTAFVAFDAGCRPFFDRYVPPPQKR